jgi:hypothetical protein
VIRVACAETLWLVADWLESAREWLLRAAGRLV